MTKLLKWLDKAERIIDIGANTGEFSKEMKKVFSQAAIMQIEANPFCEQVLRQKGIPYKIATLSSSKKITNLFVEKSNLIATGASYYRENTPFYDTGKFFQIPTETQLLDELNIFPDQVIDLVKIDCQGAELDIMKAGFNTLSRTRWLLVEVSLVEYNSGAPGIEQVVTWITSRGFDLKDIIGYHRFAQMFSGQVFQMDLLFRNSAI